VNDLFVDNALRETLNMESRGSHSRALKLSFSAALALLICVVMCSSRRAVAADPPAVNGARIEKSNAEARAIEAGEFSAGLDARRACRSGT